MSHNRSLYCTIQEGEQIFGISAWKLRTLAEADAIPATRAPQGKAWLVDIQKMNSFLAARG